MKRLILLLICALYVTTAAQAQISFYGEWCRKGGGEKTIMIFDMKEKKAYVMNEARKTCMELEDEVERLEAVLSPVLLRRAQAKLWQALYYHYDYAQPWLPQLEANLHGLKADWAKLTAYQQKQNVQSK